jgi:hypothetical protein
MRGVVKVDRASLLRLGLVQGARRQLGWSSDARRDRVRGTTTATKRSARQPHHKRRRLAHAHRRPLWILLWDSDMDEITVQHSLYNQGSMLGQEGTVDSNDYAAWMPMLCTSCLNTLWCMQRSPAPINA